MAAKAGSDKKVGIIDGLSQPACDYLRSRPDFCTLLSIDLGQNITHYVHNKLYARAADNSLVSNPDNPAGLLKVWEIENKGPRIYRRTIDFPLDGKPSLQPEINKRLGKQWNDERVRLEERLNPSFSDGVVRLILLESPGMLRLTTAKNIASFDEFFDKYLKVSEVANTLYPYLKTYLKY
jgi:hypothetical protein